MNKPKPLTEKQLTQQIKYILKLYSVFHWKQWQGQFSVAGVPDIIGIQRGTGKLIGIEIKRKDGVVRKEQKSFIDLINANGGIAFIARDVETVIEKLELGKQREGETA